MDDINIGKKIMEYRKSKNLNIRELATMASVTPSLLSQIERGVANPSINTLKVIASVLEVPLFTFFVSTVAAKDLIVRKEDRRGMVFPESHNFSYELLSPDLNGSLEMVLMTLTENSCSSEDSMGHEGEEAAYIVKGRIKLYLDDELVILNQGDSVRIPPHMKHKWENDFTETAEIVFAITPPSF
jgi:transcriptional regulator with XRE-family HTH domain